MGTTSVRRNLFHHHLSKRSVPTIPQNAPAHNGTNGSSNLSSHHTSSTSSESASSVGSGPLDGGEIVVKDKNGGYKLDIPVLPPVVGEEDGDAIEDMEDGRGTRGSGATGADSNAQTEISGREKQKIEASLIDIMYRNRNRQMSSEPVEFLNLIHQSLRNKVVSLDEDNWMYESELESRF
ncbi:hypothetical protein BDV25DRAFT_51433 [Aspergillus avenaceus]|uniref:Uncharacterized protein n=1 Tax=Aspergillus avenaceus TaxID=36643 RepID=A0A5N6TJB2_ASPAV|nr:hypothetical protein BDV25DRAFT_51433 [Aspergillus avenaceus]